MGGTETVLQTPLHRLHGELGARMVAFAGWSMPVQYEGILAEHRAVRERAGLFDVSHMGQVAVTGPGAEAFLQRALTNDVSQLAPGRALYSPMCQPDGGTLEDLIVYRRGPAAFLVVVNAANNDRDLAWFRALASGEAGGQEGAPAPGDGPVNIEDQGPAWAMLALQGPRAEAILARLGGATAGLAFFSFYEGRLQGAATPCLIARTGYTGEDGFEILCRSDDAPPLWEELLAAGGPEGLVPAGLGARDTLRLEAALPLYGHELRQDINPLEARLAPFVKLEKPAFVGREALRRAKEEGLRRRLVGLATVERGIPRAGYPVLSQGMQVGEVTSGGPAPTLGENVALALVDASMAAAGGPFQVRIRQQDVAARLVPLPFYRRGKKAAAGPVA